MSEAPPPDESSFLNRRLAAIVFADIAGFSRLIAADDVGTLRRWKALRSEVMEPLMVNHGGRVAEMAGDSVLVEFNSVVNAVRWASLIQRAQKARSDAADPLPLRLRIGINLDDVIDDDGVLQGEGVNIASRIHQAADPGQIVVTATVRDCVSNRLPVVFRDLGTPPMKNIARQVRVFAVDPLEEGRSHRAAQPWLRWSSRPTLAVLPFRNVGRALDDDYFGDGITDEIITGLSRSRSLYVIARNSTLRYRDRDKDLREIALELDVRYLLDGSVWRQGNRLRIKAELLEVDGNRTIWSQRFEGDDEEVFAFQDRIATSIVGALEPRLKAFEMARTGEAPTESLGAYHCVLKAMSRLYQFTEEGFGEATTLLDRAIELDPGYAQAHAYLAWRLMFLIGEGRSTDPAADKAHALASAERAVALDPDDAFVLSVAAHLRAFVSKQVEAADEMFDVALSLDENSAFAWGLSALTCAYLGEADDALERLQNVWRLNPFDPLNFYYWTVAGIAEFVAGRYHEAVAWSRKASRANGRFLPPLRTTAASLALAGDEEAAAARAATSSRSSRRFG